MRIGLGCTVWSRGLAQDQLDGIGYYTQELATRLAHNGCAWTPMVFGRNTPEKVQDRAVYRLPRYSTSTLFSALTGSRLPGSKNMAQRIDLFHATDHHIPKLKGTPVLATLMDAIPLAHPEWASAQFRSLKNQLWRKAAHWADHVVTISEYSKGQIVEHFGISPSRISVVPLGVDERFHERLGPDLIQTTQQKSGLTKPYFLCIGTLQPRKNVGRVLQAYQQLPTRLRQTHDLVMVGRHGWGCDALVEQLQAMPAQSGVRWLGGVSDLDKRALLQGATALVFPSLSEGFGLPVLEAFASQTPVIASCTTSLPEVAADAAWLIEPTDTEAIAHAMQHMADHPSDARQWVAKGHHRALQFTWQSCAKQTVHIYQHMLGQAT